MVPKVRSSSEAGERLLKDNNNICTGGEGAVHARDVVVGFTSTVKQSVELSEGAGPEAAVRLPTAAGVRGVTAGVGGSWCAGVDTKAVRSRGRNPAPRPTLCEARSEDPVACPCVRVAHGHTAAACGGHQVTRCGDHRATPGRSGVGFRRTGFRA